LPVKAEENYKNKIRLIYEFNRKSPLFARIASWELENNNYDSAIEILEAGLREYPDFPTPYFLLGKAYTKKNDFAKALKCYKRGSELIHSRDTYHYYLKELESYKNLKTPPEFRNLDYTVEKKEIIQPEPGSKLEDNLNELAEKISKAKIPVQPSPVKEEKKSSFFKDENTGGIMIVSETLAKIYVAQGEYDEAINVYEKLAERNPSKEEYFSQKISELKLKRKESGS